MAWNIRKKITYDKATLNCVECLHNDGGFCRFHKRWAYMVKSEFDCKIPKNPFTEKPTETCWFLLPDGSIALFALSQKPTLNHDKGWKPLYGYEDNLTLNG